VKRRTLAVTFALALLLGALAAQDAQAHIVPVGVGTQTWIEVRPRKVIVRFNLGFSSLLGIGELQTADLDRNGKITADEEQAYLERLVGRALPKIRFQLDGKPLELRLLSKQAVGMRGSIEAVGFDTFFDLEADVPPLTGPHELTYYEGTYENETSQQILYVITERADDFGSFDMEQKSPGPVIEVEGGYQLLGRDVSLRFEFLAKTLERDRAEALIEPSMQGLQLTADGLATNVARSLERDVKVLPIADVRLGVQQPSFITTNRPGFNVSMPTAKERDGASKNITLGTEADAGYAAAMTKEIKHDFSVATLLLFLLWGSLHAKMPGHGKTMVAAYLMGTKGRIWDACRLGLIVTFTHTFVLFTLGLGLVYVTHKVTEVSAQRVAERANFILTLLSGVGIVLFGLGLAWRRYSNLRKAKVASHDHGHEHTHEARPLPDKLEAPKTGKRLGLVAAAPIEVTAPHEHGPHTHTHDGHTHSHEGLAEDEHAALHAREATTEIASFKDILMLGMSGGLVPCPAGITLILVTMGLPDHAAQATFKAFIYLSSFSLGLGGVLVLIAVTMVLSRSFVTSSLGASKGRFITWAPVVGALAVAVAGALLTWQAFDPNFLGTISSRLFSSTPRVATTSTKVR